MLQRSPKRMNPPKAKMRKLKQMKQEGTLHRATLLIHRKAPKRPLLHQAMNLLQHQKMPQLPTRRLNQPPQKHLRGTPKPPQNPRQMMLRQLPRKQNLLQNRLHLKNPYLRHRQSPIKHLWKRSPSRANQRRARRKSPRLQKKSNWFCQKTSL